MTGPDLHIDLHLVLLRNGCILMGERRNVEFGAGQYHVPAGHLEAGEMIIDGIIREAGEETGIALAPDDLDLAYVMHFRGASDRLSLFFTAKSWRGEIDARTGQVRRLAMAADHGAAGQHRALCQAGNHRSHIRKAGRRVRLVVRDRNADFL